MGKIDRAPIAAAGGGILLYALRFLQFRTGFEPDTGLPISGDPFRFLAAAALIALAAGYLLMVRRLPRHSAAPLDRAFHASGSSGLYLPVIGVFLLIGSGGLEILQNVREAAAFGFVPASAFIGGTLTLLSGCGLFPVLLVARGRHSINGSRGLLLIPAACMVVQLVLAYRDYSVDPVLTRYCLELLAQAAAVLTLYQLSSFAYGVGSPRWFAFCSMLAVTLHLGALASTSLAGDWSGVLRDAGWVLLFSGLLLLRTEPETQTAQTTV